MKKIFIFLVFCSFCMPLFADVKLTAIFGDNMILQQKTKNAVWGWADPGETVTVEASWGAKASVKADKNGKWKIMLETPGYGTKKSITITGKNKIVIKNVAIGEVWLCAGQSNMGFALKSMFTGEADAAKANYPDFRIFKSSREHWHEPLDRPRDRLAEWKPCAPESAADTSAVSFYFGEKLHKELGIPVGIIVQAYAGTPIEAWMPMDIQKDDPRLAMHIQEYDKNAQRQITKEAAMENFYKELKEYNNKIDKGDKMKSKARSLTPPTITKPADLGNQYPAHIFNAMIYPIRPYGIRGAIWYQGERNADDVPQALNYRKQLALLINYYRSSWNELSEGNTAKDFPFYFTQLPCWNPPQTKPVEGLEAPWAVNREMMRLTANEVTNTGMAVAIDTGDAIKLHPKNKKPIGLRHAYLALKNVYNKNIVDYGPRYKSFEIKGDKIVLTFDSIGNGMMPAKKGSLDAFAIAGKDKKWQWADAQINGSTVVVSSKKVPSPVAVRYAWAMNPSQRNLLYNKEGIPASPFRTDDWLLFDPEKDKIIKVEKPDKAGAEESKDWTRPEMTQ